jgi:triacylglycerol lipase
VKTLAASVAREVIATLRTGFYPLSRLDPMPEPAPRPGLLPVVLVHGFLGHPDMLRPLERRLLREGFPTVHKVGYPSFGIDMDEIVARIDGVASAIEGRFHLVGHSLGGLSARYWIRDPARAARVARYVAIGTPFGGTSLYRLVPGKLRDALDPRGDVVAAVGADVPLVPTLVIRARHDHQVVPSRRSTCEGVEEAIIDGHGHNALLWAKPVHDRVVEALSRPDPRTQKAEDPG